MTLYHRLLGLVLLGFAWALGPVVDRVLGLTWAQGGGAVAGQAVIWLVSGWAMHRLGRPSLSGATWGMLILAGLGAGLNRWWVGHCGGAILVGPALGQMAHAALCVGMGALVRWAILPASEGRPARRTTAAVVAERLGASRASAASPAHPTNHRAAVGVDTELKKVARRA